MALVKSKRVYPVLAINDAVLVHWRCKKWTLAELWESTAIISLAKKLKKGEALTNDENDLVRVAVELVKELGMWAVVEQSSAPRRGRPKKPDTDRLVKQVFWLAHIKGVSKKAAAEALLGDGRLHALHRVLKAVGAFRRRNKVKGIESVTLNFDDADDQALLTGVQRLASKKRKKA